MGALSEGDGGGESASRARGIWRRDGKAERPTKFSMVKAFIGESQKRDRLRSDEACRRSLSSIVLICNSAQTKLYRQILCSTIFDIQVLAQIPVYKRIHIYI